jgi:UDP-N-acetylmuramoyl-tripeptide--D-alanyl-D-alanine ligase
VSILDPAAVGFCLAGAVLAGLRWLRVAQREHYQAGSATRFALRWWLGFGPNRLLLAIAVAGAVFSPISPLPAIASGIALEVGPFRMPLVGRAPGPLAWTRRLRVLAATVTFLTVLAVMVAALVGAAVPVAALVALLNPLIVDVACALVAPVEDHLAGRFVEAATQRLGDVAPVVVGITGSYGKTSTKAYVAHLCGPARRVVPTPASFNNRAGLSRAINEHLVPGTEVFVAEMGTYGPGEIADLCTWCPPTIAAITAVGPVHLERFGSEDAIVAAKSEIFASASVAVLNVDDPRLAAVADAQEAAGRRVWRCSSVDVAADVCVRREGEGLVASRRGAPLGSADNVGSAQAGNVAVAIAIALALDVEQSVVAGALGTLPPVANRQALAPLSTGAVAIDDTFNSNPAGCRAALDALARLGRPAGKRVVVTPGMVELGPRQAAENISFAIAMASVATDVFVVGMTNRRALLAGLSSAASADDRGPVVRLVDHREQAVAWVRANTMGGDVVLYENDLPDHYP